MLPRMAEKKDTTGFFLRPERELINRLTQLQNEFKKTKTANQIAVEIISEYIEFWAEAERARQEVIDKQRERFSRIKAEMLRLPLREASAAESGNKSVASKRKERK